MSIAQMVIDLCDAGETIGIAYTTIAMKLGIPRDVVIQEYLKAL